MPQLGFTIEASSDVLLDYAVQSTPEPLQVDPGKGEIDIVVSNGRSDGAPVTCEKIEITIPLGTIAQALTDNPGSIQLAATPSDQWAFDPVDKNNPGTFTVRPKPGYDQFTVDTTLFVQLYAIEVNPEIGTFELSLLESSALAPPTTPKRAAWKIPKFPYGFVVSDLIPAVAGKPVSEVNDKQVVTLTWTASENPAMTLTLLYGQATPVNVTKFRTWPTDPLHRDTTFILDAEVQFDGGTVNHYLTASVTVLDPDLEAGSLHVLGAAQLDGGASVGGQLSAFEASVQAGGLTVGGPLKALGQPQPVDLGSYAAAATDGFVVGTANAFGTNPTEPGWLYAACNGIVVFATAGTFSGPWGNAAVSASFLLPVPKGATWHLGLDASKTADAFPKPYCWWVPLGNRPGGVEAVRLGEVDLEAIDMPRPQSTAAFGA
jgi:hypothetical protein